VRSAFLAQNVEPISDYDGIDGIQPRDDLAGLNLTTVPKVLVECANMRNTSDAALIVTDSWQRSVAQALTTAITKFLMVG
jgi:N-acetylmuramoyl-L-alanine amidase